HLHALDAPGRIAKQHDVPGQTLNRKIFINRSDNGPFWLSHNCIVRSIRDGTAGRNRRQSRATPAFQFVIDTIMIEIGQPAPSICRNASREHLHDAIERLATKAMIWKSTTDEC